MSTIYVWMLAHERGCQGVVRDGVCSEGCDWRSLPVVASFNPEHGTTMRDRIQLARMAAMFKAREMVGGR